jgi:regulator of protease activity HflC (stomatin/prohibitin superfamily)
MIYLDTILNYLSIASWILFIVYTIAIFVRSFLREGALIALLRLISARVLVPLLIAIGISLLSESLVFIEPTQVGVVVSVVSPGGVRPQPMRAGLHFILPVLEKEVRYPIPWQTYTMSGAPDEGNRPGNDSIRARTSDGQEVRIDSSVVFRVNPEQAVTLHIDWQSRYVEEYVRPVIQGVVRRQVSQFQAREVNSSVRRDLESSLERLLSDEFSEKGLLVDQFLLRDITFTDQYANSVEEKQIALEGQERTKYEAQQVRNLAEGERDRLSIEAAGRAQQFEIEARGRAQAILLEAQAQAEALKLIAEALAQNPDLLTYEYIDKLSPNIRVMLVPNNAPLILPLPDLSEGITQTETLTATLPITPTVTPTPSLPVVPTPLNSGSAR